MTAKELTFFKALFITASIWNLIGAYFGYFNTAETFSTLFNRELTDPLIYAIYQGTWGTTLVYFIGYLIVAWDPVKHVGIVIVGGIGKVGFAIKLTQLYMAGLATDISLVIIIGDFIYTALFLYYFYRLYATRTKHAV